MNNMSETSNNTFTRFSRCTPVGQTAPACPAGWESSGFTDPGSCMIGNTPGDGPTDTWRGFGYQRVCKRTVPTSGDMAADCCSNLYGIADSLECNVTGWKPYSWSCNTAMANRCNGNVQEDPLGKNFNGNPLSQNIKTFPLCNLPDFQSGKQGMSLKNSCCTCKSRGPNPSKIPGSIGPINCVTCDKCGLKIGGELDQYCINYLRNAPSNNFFATHDYTDVPRYFPRYSYTTPDWFGEWGYNSMRRPYYPYNDWKQKYQNNYLRQFPEQGGYGYSGANDYHF